MQLKWHRITTEHYHLQSLSCPWGAYTALAAMASRLLQSPPRSTGLFLLHGHLWMSPAVLSIPLWQEGDLQCFHLLWKCLPQPQHSHSHSITRAQQYNSSHWQCRHFKPHYCVQGRHEMWGRDLNAQVHPLGSFQKKGPAFPSTLHATMRQANRAHLQQETPWDFWC